MKLISILEVLSTLGVGLCLTMFIPGGSYLEEINRSAEHYYLAFFVCMILLWGLKRKSFSRAFCRFVLPLMVLLAFDALWTLAPYYVPRDKSQLDAPRHRLFYANVDTHVGDPNQLKKLISDANPDVIALLEVSSRWLEALNLKAAYPYQTEIPREDNFGVALYSRFPFVREPELSLSELHERLPPIILTDIQMPDNRVAGLALLHTLPPVSSRNFDASELLVRRMGVHLRHYPHPYLLVGDINSGPDGGLYRRLMKTTLAENAAWGFGLSRTWNALNPLLRFTLDHVLVKGITVNAFEVGAAFGSDHFPITVDFSLASLPQATAAQGALGSHL